MSNVAESLDEIATWFEENAEAAQAQASKMSHQPVASELNGEARGWLDAAHILRRTTLKRDMGVSWGKWS